MTDDNLKQLEHVAIECGHVTHDAEWWWENCHPDMVQNLIAELRQVRRERDWLAKMLVENSDCFPPYKTEITPVGEYYYTYCRTHDCEGCMYATIEHWLKAAKEAAACPKN